MSLHISQYLSQIALPAPNSHKGQNGKLLIIGGSELFHVASKWSLDIASRFVDMVFYASIPSNNELIREAKGNFWNGIVIGRDDVPSYAEEADCILIGPGMERTVETQQVVTELLTQFTNKKWVIDAGALQMLDHQLLHSQCIITPHIKEFSDLYTRVISNASQHEIEDWFEQIAERDSDAQLLAGLQQLAPKIGGATVIIKGQQDYVFVKGQSENVFKCEVIPGGNAGMTKGGTGDVLAGLVAGLYASNEAFVAAIVGSYVNKKAGDYLYTSVGPFFNASDLVEAIPPTLWNELQKIT